MKSRLSATVAMLLLFGCSNGATPVVHGLPSTVSPQINQQGDGSVWETFSSPEILSMVAGPQTRLWFASGYIAMDGTIVTFPGPADSTNIAIGPDGAIWFVENLSSNDTVYRMDQLGNETNFVESTPIKCLTYGIATGSDGALWFSEQGCGAIGRITTDGTFTRYSTLPTMDPGPLAEGPDGAIWFVGSASLIGRIDAQGNISSYPVPTPESMPQGLAVGADGNLWSWEGLNGNWLRITPSGVMTEFPPKYATKGDGGSIVQGPGDILYASYLRKGKLARFDVKRLQAMTPLTLPGSHPGILSIAAGPDRNVYVDVGVPGMDVYLYHAMSVTPTSITENVGDTQTIVGYERHTNPSSLSAVSSDPSIAMVSAGGSAGSFDVTGEAVGACIVRVHDRDGNLVNVAVTVQ